MVNCELYCPPNVCYILDKLYSCHRTDRQTVNTPTIKLNKSSPVIKCMSYTMSPPEGAKTTKNRAKIKLTLIKTSRLWSYKPDSSLAHEHWAGHNSVTVNESLFCGFLKEEALFLWITFKVAEKEKRTFCVLFSVCEAGHWRVTPVGLLRSADSAASHSHQQRRCSHPSTTHCLQEWLIVRLYSAVLTPRLPLAHNNARPHVAGVCQQFLDDDTMDWPACVPSCIIAYASTSLHHKMSGNLLMSSPRKPGGCPYVVVVVEL